MKMRKIIILSSLVIFVLAYAGCAGKYLTPCEKIASAQKESAIKQNEQTSIGSTPVKQEESVKQSINKEQTTLKPTVSQLTADLKDIHFNYDKYNLQPEDREILTAHAKWLLKNSKYIVKIEGNCDERGTEEYNMALGQKRADEAKTYLIDMGINKKRITTISYGKDRPLDPAHNEEAWAKNRRDDFVLSK